VPVVRIKIAPQKDRMVQAIRRRGATMKTELTRALGAIVVALCLVSVGAHADDGDARMIEIEKALWAGWAQADIGPFERHATDEAVNVTPDGITVGKAELIKYIGSGTCKVAGYSLGDMRVVHPADNVALVVYSAEQDAACGDSRLAPRIYVTSVFLKTDGEWRSVAYSETPAGQ